MKKEILYGAAGVLGVGVVSWRTLFPWIGDDIRTATRFRSAEKETSGLLESETYMVDLFERSVSKNPNKVLLIFEDTEYTYGFVNSQANRVANAIKSWDVDLGETVALMIYNEPAFVWTLLGLMKLGISAALINFNIKKEGLVHSIEACDAKYLIVGQGKRLLDVAEEVKAQLNIPIYIQDEIEHLPDGYLSFNQLMSRSIPAAISKVVRKNLKMQTPLAYIFTSGTTGLPKAAIIRQAKAIGILLFMKVGGIRESDVLHNTLPLYHSAALLIGLMSVQSAVLEIGCLPAYDKYIIGTFQSSKDTAVIDLVKTQCDVWDRSKLPYVTVGESAAYLGTGCTMVLKRKFSAHQFFDDCRRHNVTVIQYIGELLRYLLVQPKSPLDKTHKIRFALGNGLRKDIWMDFQKRFNIPEIYEFFAATDGAGAFINVSNKLGAVGRHSPLLRLLGSTITIVKYDENTATPTRDRNGRCVPISSGEQGLVLGGLQPDMALQKEKFYKGNIEEDEKKLIHNAFIDGDMYFNFGDVVYLDHDYFVYFRDRIGDTFRWKGENVSTTEVANCLTSVEFIENASVYGVKVPGTEGRAGMAAIFLTKRDDSVTEDMLKAIYKMCEAKLPSYARPIFLRFPKNMQLTSTYKHTKVDFQKEAYNPSVVDDQMFFVDDKMKTYIPITQNIFTMLNTKSKL